MFVFLSKFLPLFFYPVGLVCILLGGLLIIKPKIKGWQRTITWLALIVLFVGGNQWVSESLAKSLEWRYLPQESYPQVEAIVVLGGGTESRQTPRPQVEVNGAGDRVLYAAKLYQDGVAPKLILSGGNIDFIGSRTTTPAEDMAEILDLIGIPREAMWLQSQSQNTYEDALYSAKILREEGIEKIILVTSAMHMPRSVALFQQQGLEVIPAPVDYSITQYSWDDLWTFRFPEILIDILPTAGNLSTTTAVMKEYIGRVVYHLRGWL